MGRRRGHPAVEAKSEVGRQREERGRQEGLPLRGLLGGSEGKGEKETHGQCISVCVMLLNAFKR